MSSKVLKKAACHLAVFTFWILLWFLLSLFVGNSYFLPSPFETLLALIGLLSGATFYKVALFSLFRVLFGLFLGVMIGTALAVICHRFKLVRMAVSPVISVIKAMPVATFIIILWITLRGSALSIFIGFMMVMPIIYQNLIEGYDSLDKNLLEVTEIFEFSTLKRYRMLILPHLCSYFIPAFITSIGLAFKSQIAAEIIAYTKDSIGQYIFDAKYDLKTDLVFAWAVVIVSFSVLLEYLAKKLSRRFKK